MVRPRSAKPLFARFDSRPRLFAGVKAGEIGFDCLSGKARRFLVFISAALIAGCATPYQPMGYLGGYREIRMAADIYRVMFFGNGYTNSELAAEYALRRCADLTQQNGYRYFGILGANAL
jgi:hypothetical protein